MSSEWSNATNKEPWWALFTKYKWDLEVDGHGQLLRQVVKPHPGKKHPHDIPQFTLCRDANGMQVTSHNCSIVRHCNSSQRSSSSLSIREHQDGGGTISSASGSVTWESKMRLSERRDKDRVAPWVRVHWPTVDLNWTPIVGSAAPSRRAWSWCRNDALVKVAHSRTPLRTTTASDDPRRRSSSDYLSSLWLAAGSVFCCCCCFFYINKKKARKFGQAKITGIYTCLFLSGCTHREGTVPRPLHALVNLKRCEGT